MASQQARQEVAQCNRLGTVAMCNRFSLNRHQAHGNSALSVMQTLAVSMYCVPQTSARGTNPALSPVDLETCPDVPNLRTTQKNEKMYQHDETQRKASSSLGHAKENAQIPTGSKRITRHQAHWYCIGNRAWNKLPTTAHRHEELQTYSSFHLKRCFVALLIAP